MNIYQFEAYTLTPASDKPIFNLNEVSDLSNYGPLILKISLKNGNSYYIRFLTQDFLEKELEKLVKILNRLK